MNRERAETFLRLLAEAELRRVCARLRDGLSPPDGPEPGVALLRGPAVAGLLGDLPVRPREAITLRYRVGLSETETATVMRISPGAVNAHAARGISMVLEHNLARLRRVAQVLTAVGALDQEVADQIVNDGRVALFVRGGSAGRLRLEQLLRLAPVQRRPARADATPPGPVRVVPLGRLIEIQDADVTSELSLLSYARTASGPQLSVFAPTAGPELFGSFTATDDRGTSYRVSLRDIGNGPLGWTLMLHPDPPHDPRWLDLTTTPGRPAVRIGLDHRAAGTAADMTVSDRALSPGEYLLHTIAARLLAAAPAVSPDRLTRMTDGLGDCVAALQACGALSVLSPVPGQLAALCASLDVHGHGITAPLADDLPEPWLNVLARHRRRKTKAVRARDGWAAAAVVLPELDGISLALLGLHNSQYQTILHMHASGPGSGVIDGPHELYAWPAVWIRDDGGHWHATRTIAQSGMPGGVALRLEVAPPLSPATAWIELLVASQSAEARATLPLHWQ